MSSSDSPFSTELPFAAKFSESAESHFSAVSKEKRVRVDASKKRFTTIRPRRAGTFLICRWPIDRIDSAVSRISVISSGERVSIPRRSLDLGSSHGWPKAKFGDDGGDFAELELTNFGLSFTRLFQDPDLVRAVGLLEHHLDDLAAAVGTLLPT